MPEPTTQQEREARLYVACHECNNCGHIGINDTSDSTSACNTCDWEGPEPKEDKCPGCKREGTMTSACPACGARYHLLAEARLPARSLPPADAPSVRELQPEDWLNEGDLAALRRLDDLFSDGEGYDLPKAQMSRLAEIGCIRHCGSGRYEITSFGMKLVGSWRRLPLETCAEANERSRIDAALAHQEGERNE